MHVLDREKLQFDLNPDQDAVFVDEEGHLVMVVMRNFCKDERIVQWVNDIVLQGVQNSWNICVCVIFFFRTLACTESPHRRRTVVA